MRVSAKIAALEIKDDEVRLAVVRTGGRYPTVLEVQAERAVYETPEQKPAALAAAVRAVVERMKTRPAVTVLALSCEWTIVRLLTLPVTGGKRVRGAVQFELEPYLAIPIEDLVVDHTPIRVSDGRTRVLAVGLRRTTLEEHLAILEEAGIEADGVDVDAVGLTSLWQAGAPKHRGLRAVLHMRPDDAVLTILHGKTLAYFRILSISSSQLHENPKAVARDVLNSLRSFTAAWNKDTDGEADRETIQSLSVTGVELFEEERTLLDSEVGVPVAVEDVLHRVKGFGKAVAKAGVGDPGGPQHNVWAGVIGAANAAAGEAYALNFRKQEYKPVRTFRGLRSQLVFSVLLVLLMFAGFGAYAYVSYSRNVTEARRLGEEMWQEYAAAFPESAAETPRSPDDFGGARTYQRMRQERDDWYSRGTQISLDMFTRPTALDVLTELAQAMPGDKVDLVEVRVTPGRPGRSAEIHIRGEATQAAAVDEAETKLRNSAIIKMRPDSVRRSSSGNKENFQIDADL